MGLIKNLFKIWKAINLVLLHKNLFRPKFFEDSPLQLWSEMSQHGWCVRRRSYYYFALCWCAGRQGLLCCWFEPVHLCPLAQSRAGLAIGDHCHTSGELQLYFPLTLHTLSWFNDILQTGFSGLSKWTSEMSNGYLVKLIICNCSHTQPRVTCVS